MQSIARSRIFSGGRLPQQFILKRSPIVAGRYQKSLYSSSTSPRMSAAVETTTRVSQGSNNFSSEKFIIDDARNILRSHYDSPLPEKVQHRSPLPSAPNWRQSNPAPLSRDSLLDLFDLKVPTIHCPRFLSTDVAQKLEDHLSPKLSPYTNSMGPPLFKVGLAQFEFQAKVEQDLKNRTNAGEYPCLSSQL